jgi:hypothetical protein
MKRLLINGCSFAEYWQVSPEWITALGCDSLVNIGKGGTSFQRTCRSTVEWIAQNGLPHFVMIPITFAHRWELALNQNEDDIDGSWVPLQNSNLLAGSYKLQYPEEFHKLCEQYYKIIPTVKTHWDKLFTEIITFAGFLEQQQIRYLMWDMCNGFDMKHIKGYKGFQKIKMINHNKKIIDIWNFCGNRFMRDTMPADIRIQTPEFAHHHEPAEYKHLETKLINYLTEHQLL